MKNCKECIYSKVVAPKNPECVSEAVCTLPDKELEGWGRFFNTEQAVITAFIDLIQDLVPVIGLDEAQRLLKIIEKAQLKDGVEMTNEVITENFDENKLLVELIADKRFTNPLRRAGIHTVMDFLYKSDKELLGVRAFGKGKLKAVKEAVYNYVKTTHGERSRDEWIPVSEGLPEEQINPNTNDFQEVLCTTVWNDVRSYKYGKPIGHDEAHFWYGGRIMDEYVIAWRYKPEPYKKGGKE